MNAYLIIRYSQALAVTGQILGGGLNRINPQVNPNGLIAENTQEAIDYLGTGAIGRQDNANQPRGLGALVQAIFNMAVRLQQGFITSLSTMTSVALATSVQITNSLTTAVNSGAASVSSYGF